MLRKVALGLVILALLLVTVGTGTFGAATADRGTAVDVVDDPEAYVGVEGCTITNNANQHLTVTLNDTQELELGPGESDQVEVEGETTIEAEGSSLSAEMERTFEDCVEDDEEVEDDEGEQTEEEEQTVEEEDEDADEDDG